MFKSKFIIKDIVTGEYFIGWDFGKDTKGNFLYREPVHPGHYYGKVVVKKPIFSKTDFPKLYNTIGGAGKVISEFTGQSYRKQEKMNASQKVLFGSKDLSKYEIVEVCLKIK